MKPKMPVAMPTEDNETALPVLKRGASAVVLDEVWSAWLRPDTR